MCTAGQTEYALKRKLVNIFNIVNSSPNFWHLLCQMCQSVSSGWDACTFLLWWYNGRVDWFGFEVQTVETILCVFEHLCCWTHTCLSAMWAAWTQAHESIETGHMRKVYFTSWTIDSSIYLAIIWILQNAYQCIMSSNSAYAWSPLRDHASCPVNIPNFWEGLQSICNQLTFPGIPWWLRILSCSCANPCLRSLICAHLSQCDCECPQLSGQSTRMSPVCFRQCPKFDECNIHMRMLTIPDEFHKYFSTFRHAMITKYQTRVLFSFHLSFETFTKFPWDCQHSSMDELTTF